MGVTNTEASGELCWIRKVRFFATLNVNVSYWQLSDASQSLKTFQFLVALFERYRRARPLLAFIMDLRTLRDAIIWPC
jgi:hypothetical protein